MLRDRLVCGIKDEHIQRCLLSEEKLTFKKALEIAQRLETAAKNIKMLQGQDSCSNRAIQSGEVHKLKVKTQICYRCGKSNHLADKCHFRDVKCHNCGKTGHIHKVCCGLKKVVPLPQITSKIKQLVTDEKEGGSEMKDEYDLFTLSSKSTKPLNVTLEVEGDPLPMELDTGASHSVISYETYRHLSNIKTYSGDPLQVKGTLEVKTSHGERRAKLPLVVVSGNRPSLIGHKWLSLFQLDWKEIHSLQNSSLQNIIQSNAGVFKEGLGTLNGFEVKINVEDGAKPRFCKVRTVPYSIRTKVEEELDRK